MRCSKFMETTATEDGIKIESLRLLENADQQHSYWVYLQVMDWKFLEKDHADPLESGWVLCNGYHPRYTEQSAAQADFLKYVRCKCKHSSKSSCSMNCSCKKNGLYCVAACGHCQSGSCQNENYSKNVSEGNCKQNDKRNIFDICNLLDT